MEDALNHAALEREAAQAVREDFQATEKRLSKEGLCTDCGSKPSQVCVESLNAMPCRYIFVSTDAKPNAHSSHATLIAELCEMKRQRDEALDALGKENHAALEAAPTMTQQVMREEYAAQRLEHAVQLRVQAELKKYTNRSDSTLILLLTEKDAEIAELTRQLNESRDALGKEKAALNQTLKKVSELETLHTKWKEYAISLGAKLAVIQSE